jgi:hypothetical protein
MPTAPSPTLEHVEPFEGVDDVPSALSEDNEEIPRQVLEVEIPRLPPDLPGTMTPPLTPKLNQEDRLEGENHGLRLLARLGGYGWRG